MTENERQLAKRFQELSDRAASQNRWTYSEFLNMAEQDTLCRTSLVTPYTLEGGYPSAERMLAVFGSESDFGYPAAPPIACLALAPASQKFSDDLTHRDFLGALIGLGIRRAVLGDILISENCGYLFCLDAIADFILQQVTQVKRTTIRVSRADAPPVSITAPPEAHQIVVASERLDSVVAAVYNLSRAESQILFKQGKVAVNSRLISSPSATAKSGAIVSVRGYGRFVYEGIEKETRKARLRVSVRVY